MYIHLVKSSCKTYQELSSENSSHNKHKLLSSITMWCNHTKSFFTPSGTSLLHYNDKWPSVLHLNYYRTVGRMSDTAKGFWQVATAKSKPHILKSTDFFHNIYFWKNNSQLNTTI